VFKSEPKIGGKAFRKKFTCKLESLLKDQFNNQKKLNKDRRKAAEQKLKAEEDRKRLEREVSRSKVVFCIFNSSFVLLKSISVSL
jgi:hypothetical protein